MKKIILFFTLLFFCSTLNAGFATGYVFGSAMSSNNTSSNRSGLIQGYPIYCYSEGKFNYCKWRDTPGRTYEETCAQYKMIVSGIVILERYELMIICVREEEKQK